MKKRHGLHLITCVALLLISSSWAHAEKVVIMGSDTLGAKLTVRLAEEFRTKMEQRGVPVAFEISSEGTTTALASVTDGTSDIGMASRAPKKTELTTAQARGVNVRSITVGFDAIAIIVHESNPIDSVTLEELEYIYSGDLSDWSGITASQSGKISAYTRNTASGTYSILQEVALASRDYGEDTLQLAGNEQIASEVASNPLAIGYVGLAYTQTPGLKVIPIDGLHPNEPGYPLGRELRFLIDGNQTLNAMTNDFIGFTLSPEGQAIVEQVNFLPVY